MRRRALLLLTLLTLSLPAGARERLVRAIGPADGLPTARVTDVAQDVEGFLWIAGEGGLLRYDGIEPRPWGKAILSGKVSFLATGPGGEVLAAGPSGRLFEVVSEGLRPLGGPTGKPLSGVSQATFSAKGTLWLLKEAVLLSRTSEGTWGELAAEHFGGERLYRLAPGQGNDLLVMTGRGVWSVGPDRTPKLLLTHPRVAQALVGPDGTLVAVDWEGTLVRSGGGNIEQRLLGLKGPRDMVLRGRTLWISFPLHLVAVPPDEDPEILDAGQDFTGGGRLLLDREGGLWMATPRGLSYYPEPDTVVLGERDGLPSTHTRFVQRTWEGLWVSTWQGLGRLDHRGYPNPYVDDSPIPLGRQTLCRDAADGLWTQQEIQSGGETIREVILERREARSVQHSEAGRARFSFACAPATDGRVWIARDEEILLTPPQGGRPRIVAYFPSDAGRPLRLLEDSSNRLWIARHPATLCWAEAGLLRRDEAASWICDDLPGAGEINDLAEGPSKGLWVATRAAGVLHHTKGGWAPVMDPARLPSPTVLGLTPSPRGGVWVAGDGLLARVDRGEGGWTIVEEPSAWNGIAAGGAERVLEEEDGTLWVTGPEGLLRLPPEARDASRAAPPVRLVGLRADDGGERKATGVTMEAPLELSHRGSRLELRFAALSFREPSLLRYRVRHHSGAPWLETRDPTFRFVDPAPGEYRVEVSASLDGSSWSEIPAQLSFRVLRPWYRQVWALVLGAAAILAALRLAYRLGRAAPRRVPPRRGF